MFRGLREILTPRPAPAEQSQGTLASICESATGRARRVLDGVIQSRGKAGDIAGQGEFDWMRIARQRLSDALADIDRVAARRDEGVSPEMDDDRAEIERVLALVESALGETRDQAA